MSWCDPKPGTGLSPANWQYRYLPIGGNRRCQLAREPRDGHFAWSEELLYGRRGASSTRRHVVRQLAPGSCVDWRGPYFVEGWGWGDAQA